MAFHDHRARRAPATAPGGTAAEGFPAVAHVAAPDAAAPVTPRRPTVRRGRVALAAVLGAILVAVSALPAGAAWPVASRYSYLSQKFHSGHRGNDIAAPRGTRIVPMASGVVVFAGWKSNCGGWQVWVNHRNGLYSAYYHMSKETSYSGKPVYKSSTTLGYVGDSGCSYGNHLHVEVWRGYPWRSGSYRINPWSYIDSGTYLPYRYR